MANPRLVRFWVEIDKIKKMFANDPFIFGFYVIDKQNMYAEIDGDKYLKQQLFDTSSLINAKWKKEMEKPSENSGPTVIRPEGTSCWLPKLPLGGISSMTDKVLKSYWSRTMRSLLPDRKGNLGYDTYRFVLLLSLS